MAGRGGGGAERKMCLVQSGAFFSVKQNRTFHKSFKIHDKLSLLIFL